MSCYRKGGCGPYEMYSCSECPASKPEYALKYKEKSSNVNNNDSKEVNLKNIALEICDTEIGMFEEFKKRLERVKAENEAGIVSVIQDFFNANASTMNKLSELEKFIIDKEIR